MQMSPRVANAADDRISLIRPSTPEPRSLVTKFRQEANAAHSGKRCDTTQLSSHLSSSQNSLTTSVQQDEAPMRIHQKNVQTPKTSRDAIISGARSPLSEHSPPYAGNATIGAVAVSASHDDAPPATSTRRDAASQTALKLRLRKPLLHRRTEVSLSQPHTTSQVPLESAITSVNYLGLQDPLHPLLTSSRRIKRDSHAHEHEEPARLHQEDTLTRGYSRKNNRPSSQHPQTEDATRSHYRDPEAAEGPQNAQGGRSAISLQFSV
jgi:hypothetical protein